MLVVLGTMVVAGGRIGDASITVWYWPEKAVAITYFISGYSFTLSCISFVLLCTFMVIDRKHLAFVGAGAWVAVGLAILFLAMPTRLFDTAFVVERVLVAAGLIVPAFISVTSSQASRRLAVVVCAITLASLLHASYVWLSYAQIYSTVKASFVRLEKGARILVAHGGLENPLVDFPIFHVPTLAVHYANAFVATFFAAPGKQPIAVRAEFRDLLSPQVTPGRLLLWKTLRKARQQQVCLAIFVIGNMNSITFMLSGCKIAF